MTDCPIWMSPSEAADAVYDVRADGVIGCGYSILRPQRSGRTNSVVSLAFSKLNPIEPTVTSPRTRCGWPTTARDHRLVLAPGVADPVSLARLFSDYDAVLPDRQRLLAVVLTMPMSRDEPLHDQFDAAVAFATLKLARERRLTSLVVCHAPGDQMADEAPHAHVIILPRLHRASGWAQRHPDFDQEEERHGFWADAWAHCLAQWRDTLSD